MQNFYLSLLNANQRYCYQILESAVRAKMPSYNAPNGLSAADISAVNKAFTFEHPEICYFPGIETAVSGNSVRLRYLNSDQGAFERKVDEVFNQIRKNLKGKTDEYSIVKAIYEYITLNYTYDHKLFDEYRNIVNSGGNLEAFESGQAYGFTVYGFFMNNKAVCFGIAKGFKLLCDRFNISCMLVPCNERLPNDEKGSPHIFNRVRINGKESFVDCTYGLVSKSFPMLHYELFLASKEDVDRFYILENELSGRVVSENYYVKKRTIFNNKYALRMYLASYDAVINKGCVRFKYIGNDMALNEVQDFALEILNRHAPRGKTYLANFLNGRFNGLLLTQKEADKLSKLSEEDN